jgi:hypothetical protein
MALTDFTPSETAEINILHPRTNAPLGLSVVIFGRDSGRFKEIQRKQLNRRLERSNKSRTKQQAPTAEEMESEALDLLVACTQSWSTGDRNQLELSSDEWLDCTPDNVRLAYTRFPWLREQVDQEIGDRANFLQG